MSLETAITTSDPGGTDDGRSTTAASTTTTPDITTSSATTTPAPTSITTQAPSSTSTKPKTTATTTTTLGTTTLAAAQPVPVPGAAPSVLALIGTDSREDLDDTSNFGEFGGERADVIALAIRDGDELSLLSIPRDLYTEDICNGGRHRISSAFADCGDRNSLANLVAELENLTGLDIEHAVAVDIAGFHEIVDLLGGYEICTDYPLRDRKSGLELDSGCVTADGYTTLSWLRSRSTERFVDGQWVLVPGVSDLTRNERQRQFLIDMLHRQSGRSAPGAVLDLIEAAAPHLTIDDQLALTDAASWVWDLRNADIVTHEIPVAPETTSTGAEVLLPTVEVGQYVAELGS